MKKIGLVVLLLAALPLAAEQNIGQYLTGPKESKLAVAMHQELDCLGFTNQNKPYQLLSVKDPRAMQALLEQGNMVLILWMNQAKKLITTIAYWNPYSKKAMAILASFEDTSVAKTTPFSLGEIPPGYGIYGEGMFLVKTVKDNPNANLYKKCK